MLGLLKSYAISSFKKDNYNYFITINAVKGCINNKFLLVCMLKMTPNNTIIMLTYDDNLNDIIRLNEVIHFHHLVYLEFIRNDNYVLGAVLP